MGMYIWFYCNINLYETNTFSNLGNPDCPLNADKKDKYKERCFPFFWDKSVLKKNHHLVVGLRYKEIFISYILLL